MNIDITVHLKGNLSFTFADFSNTCLNFKSIETGTELSRSVDVGQTDEFETL